MSFHLKHDSSGHLIHGSAGHLSVGCGSGGGGGCACVDIANPCSLCPGDTPTQFHVTFTGISLCSGCVDCGPSGPSAQIGAGSSINGTYLMAKDGPCGWVTESADIPCSLTLYSGEGCTGTAVPLDLAIEQIRIDANTFLLQITDAGNNIVLFTATVTLAQCCHGYTVANETGGCGCSGSPTVFALATGGNATVTPC